MALVSEVPRQRLLIACGKHDSQAPSPNNHRQIDQRECCCDTSQASVHIIGADCLCPRWQAKANCSRQCVSEEGDGNERFSNDLQAPQLVKRVTSKGHNDGPAYLLIRILRVGDGDVEGCRCSKTHKPSTNCIDHPWLTLFSR